MNKLDSMINYLFVKLRKSNNNTVTITKDELVTLAQEIRNEKYKLQKGQNK